MFWLTWLAVVWGFFRVIRDFSHFPEAPIWIKSLVNGYMFRKQGDFRKCFWKNKNTRNEREIDTERALWPKEFNGRDLNLKFEKEKVWIKY